MLRDDELRKLYDEVLANGLPNWRQPIYYFRSVSKLSVWQTTVLLLAFATLAQCVMQSGEGKERKERKEKRTWKIISRRRRRMKNEEIKNEEMKKKKKDHRNNRREYVKIYGTGKSAFHPLQSAT